MEKNLYIDENSLKVIHKKTTIKLKNQKTKKAKNKKKHEKESLLKFDACSFKEKHLYRPNRY
jgi:hypothetical protein